MSRHRQTAAALAVLLSCLAGCSEPDSPAASSAPAAAAAVPAGAAPAPAPAERRALAERALSAQRIYSPAGDSAIEYFLQLREDGGADPALETTLLELLPYAVIGSEQAVARQDLPEAERLLAMIERIDANAPAVARLKAQVAAATAALAERAIAQAEAEAQRALQAQREAEIAAVAAATGTSQLPAAVANAAPTAPPPAPALAQTAAVVPPPTPETPAAAPLAADTAAPQPTPAVADPVATRARTATTPALISAPPPRYPFSALRRKLEGDVTVAFTIQPDGSVDSPRVVATTAPGLFDQAALAAASRWRFESTPVPVEVTRELRFRLESAQP